MGTLTEHGLQPHQAAHEVIEVHGQVRLRVAGDHELIQLLVELEAWPRRVGENQGGPAQPKGTGRELRAGRVNPGSLSLKAIAHSTPHPHLCGLRPVTSPLCVPLFCAQRGQ